MKPCALVLVQTPDHSKILLVLRRDVPVWVLPGGGIEEGESPEAAAHRELQEETGLFALKLKQRGHYLPINALTQETSLFSTDAVEGTPVPTIECVESTYFPLDGLPKGLFFLHRLWIERALHSDAFAEGQIKEVTWCGLIAYAIRHPWIALRFLWTQLRKDG